MDEGKGGFYNVVFLLQPFFFFILYGGQIHKNNGLKQLLRHLFTHQQLTGPAEFFQWIYFMGSPGR